MKNMSKTIISTGIGKLHFFEAGLALHKAEFPIEIITGWRPQGHQKLINLFGNLISQSNLSNRLNDRRPFGLEDVPVHSCSLAEGFSVGLNLLAKYSIIPNTHASTIGFKNFGRSSKHFIENAAIFHVRSGAGQGGAIAKARAEGMKIVVDHSIAHPLAMQSILKPEFERFNLPLELEPNNQFWKMIIKDCMEADILLVNSDYVKETFIESGYPASKICVVYWGVRQDFLGIKKDYKISNPIRLLFTGHFDLRKGVRVLLEALKILEDQGTSCQLDIVGSVSSGSHALKEHPALTKNIRFHGFVPQEELKSFLCNSDIFVFPTLAEGSSRSAMEAMSAGLPVITTRNCGVPIEDDMNGLYVTVGDANQLAHAICKLSRSEELRKRIGVNATRTISQNYTWSTYANSLIDIYRKILQ